MVEIAVKIADRDEPLRGGSRELRRERDRGGRRGRRRGRCAPRLLDLAAIARKQGDEREGDQPREAQWVSVTVSMTSSPATVVDEALSP